MDVRITPEPSPEEREAILRALATLSAERPLEPSPWWRQGLLEAVGDEPGLDAESHN